MRGQTKRTTAKPPLSSGKTKRKTMRIGRDPVSGRFVSTKNVRPGQKIERIKRGVRTPKEVSE